MKNFVAETLELRKSVKIDNHFSPPLFAGVTTFLDSFGRAERISRKIPLLNADLSTTYEKL